KTHHVVAWINTAGGLQGTALTHEYLFQGLEFLVGPFGAAGKESLTTTPGRERVAFLCVPRHVFFVNYVCIPLTRTLSFFARSSFLSLRKYGPNDGISLLADMVYPGGVTLADLGNDHFMRGKPLDITTVALALSAVRWLEHADSELVQGPGS